ncbi:hypothetical protein [Wenyingzhuangia aestuarii]|uniref:hypothetical protein n=1 Tax=Wenyingzhuangia aestuarii TaxID=1647582 RepID=UPI0014388A82|nr:hypothetical protein [Wenyingzhuangia aestuarii]NJB83659.1 hypothetical protein [Wenyingzhuangia aestuarii]
MKIAGLHAWTHTEDEHHVEHCVVCDYALTHNAIPVLVSEASDFLFINYTP